MGASDNTHLELIVGDVPGFAVNLCSLGLKNFRDGEYEIFTVPVVK